MITQIFCKSLWVVGIVNLEYTPKFSQILLYCCRAWCFIQNLIINGFELKTTGQSTVCRSRHAFILLKRVYRRSNKLQRINQLNEDKPILCSVLSAEYKDTTSIKTRVIVSRNVLEQMNCV